MSYISLFFFSSYFIVLLLIGYIAYKRNDDFSDYILGGRKLGPVVGGISTGASDMSAFLLLGIPGAIYVSGLAGAWLPIGLAIGAYLNWQFVGNRIRKFTIVAGDSETLPEFLQNRTKDTSKLIKIISSFFIIVFFTFYVSSGLVAGGLMFEQSFGVTYEIGLIIIALVIFIYTTTGGFYAVTWTDFIQGIIMFLAVVIVAVVTTNVNGGFSETVSKVSEINNDHLNVLSGTTTLGIISMLAWGIGYFGQPHALVRFMAFKSARDIVIGRAVYTIWNVVALYGALLIGFAGIAYFGTPGLDDPESGFIILADVLFNPWVTGFLLLGLLSAIMSTVSTQLLVSATALAEDIYKGLFRKKAEQKELFLVIRISIALVIGVALVIALNPESSILDLVGYAWAGFGAVFGPAVLCSLFWRGTTRNGVVAGMIVGGITIFLWSFLSTPPTDSAGIAMAQSEAIIPFELYEIIPGFFFSLLAILIFSKIGPKPTKEMEREYDAIKNSNV